MAKASPSLMRAALGTSRPRTTRKGKDVRLPYEGSEAERRDREFKPPGGKLSGFSKPGDYDTSDMKKSMHNRNFLQEPLEGWDKSDYPGKKKRAR